MTVLSTNRMKTSDIIILRTDEISDDLWRQIGHGYKVCFDIEHTPDEFRESFSRSITGYTFHALKFTEDGKLMGHNYFQPRPYILNGEKVICAVSGGTFVLPEYRKDIFIFKELFTALSKHAKSLGWIAQIGVPNENSFKYAVKINKEKYIGDLNYYILPVHASKIIKHNNKLLDGLSHLYSTIITKGNLFLSHIINLKEKKVPLHIDENEQFLSLRLSHLEYKHIKEQDLRATYRVYDEDGINTAYIIYFSQNGKRTSKALSHTVNTILKNEKIDAILYIGTMNMAQTLLTRVPKKFVPHRLTATVAVFDKTNKELVDILSSLKNIDYGLINFDVR